MLCLFFFTASYLDGFLIFLLRTVWNKVNKAQSLGNLFSAWLLVSVLPGSGQTLIWLRSDSVLILFCHSQFILCTFLTWSKSVRMLALKCHQLQWSYRIPGLSLVKKVCFDRDENLWNVNTLFSWISLSLELLGRFKNSLFTEEIIKSFS